MESMMMENVKESSKAVQQKNSLNALIHWLDLHLEETFLVVMLVLIAGVTMLQVIVRKIPGMASLTWAEELCRFLWIWSVFLSLPYTIRTDSMLRVGVLKDLLPETLRKVLNLAVDGITLGCMSVLGLYGVEVVSVIGESHEISPAMQWPMAFVYSFMVLGFFLAALLNVLACYPILALILHPRTCREFYRGAAHRELLEETMDRAPFPVIYNGDIFDAADGQQMIRQHPRLSGLMLGRGLAANPALAREIAGGSPLSRQDVIRFHDRLFREYMKFWPASAAVGRMHAIMGYLGQCFEDGAHALRDVKRAAQPEDYLDAAARFFSQCDLRPNPRFIPPG